MSSKATITQKEIVNAAFKITRKEGFEQITSRKLAAAAGCSTQPIFRIYENMDGLMYHTEVPNGTYKVVMTPLEGPEYEDYIMPSEVSGVKVTDNIEYKSFKCW